LISNSTLKIIVENIFIDTTTTQYIWYLLIFLDRDFCVKCKRLQTITSRSVNILARGNLEIPAVNTIDIKLKKEKKNIFYQYIY
jgi:hypothetical protein